MSTNQPVRLPFIGRPSQRRPDEEKDWNFINCYPETSVNEEMNIIKRPGFQPFITEIEGPGEGRGLYNWRGNVVSVIDDTIYFNTSAVTSIGEEDRRVTFAEVDNLFLAIQNGNEVWLIDRSGGFEQITDEDFPGQFDELAQGVSYLNGLIYVVTKGGEVYNSNSADVTEWNALNFIRAQSEADVSVRIIRHLNYLLVLGTRTVEAFTDAGLEPPGSPLQPADNAYLKLGCAAPDSVVQANNQLFWIGRDEGGGFLIVSMSGLQADKISTPKEDKIVNSFEAEIDKVVGYSLRLNGHFFYFLNFPDRTLVYDTTEQVWHEWRYNDGPFPAVDAAFFDERNLFLHESDANIYNILDTSLTDDGQTIPIEIQTIEWDADTRLSKFMKRLELIADIPSDSNAVAKVSWTDDDYQTFSPERDVNFRRPALYRGGQFVRRAFRVRVEEDIPIRLRALEMRVGVGSYGVR